MKKLLLSSILLTGLTLQGCTSISGLDASDEFSCNAPLGVSCASVTEVYESSQNGSLPAQQNKNVFKSDAGEDRQYIQQFSSISPNSKHIIGKAPVSGTPIYKQKEVMRIWIAPWEDSENVLHDQSFMYITVQDEHWQIERLKQDIERENALSINHISR